MSDYVGKGAVIWESNNMMYLRTFTRGHGPARVSGMRLDVEAKQWGRVDVAPLRDYIAGRGAEVWHFKCPVRALEDCTRIILRHSRDYNFDFDDIIDWPLMDEFRPYVQPVVDAVCAAVGKSRVSALFIANLPAGKNILPHVDSGDFLAIPSRVHVPLKTNPGVRYHIGGVYIEDERPDKMSAQKFAKKFHMAEGEIWEIDNMSCHSVENAGAGDRWHLVVNIW